MSRTIRHSKRQPQKAKRKAKRKEARKNGNGKKAGSIAIHSRLPGLEGAQIGAMDVVVDTRRSDAHPAEISVSIHQRMKQRAVIWTIETGFGGHLPRVGFQVMSEGSIDDLPPTCWFPDLESLDEANITDINATESTEAEAEATMAEELRT